MLRFLIGGALLLASVAAARASAYLEPQFEGQYIVGLGPNARPAYTISRDAKGIHLTRGLSEAARMEMAANLHSVAGTAIGGSHPAYPTFIANSIPWLGCSNVEETVSAYAYTSPALTKPLLMTAPGASAAISQSNFSATIGGATGYPSGEIGYWSRRVGTPVGVNGSHDYWQAFRTYMIGTFTGNYAALKTVWFEICVEMSVGPAYPNAQAGPGVSDTLADPQAVIGYLSGTQTCADQSPSTKCQGFSQTGAGATITGQLAGTNASGGAIVTNGCPDVSPCNFITGLSVAPTIILVSPLNSWTFTGQCKAVNSGGTGQTTTNGNLALNATAIIVQSSANINPANQINIQGGDVTGSGYLLTSISSISPANQINIPGPGLLHAVTSGSSVGGDSLGLTNSLTWAGVAASGVVNHSLVWGIDTNDAPVLGPITGGLNAGGDGCHPVPTDNSILTGQMRTFFGGLPQ